MQIGCSFWLVNSLCGINSDIIRNEASKICFWGGYFESARGWGFNIFTWNAVTMPCSLVRLRGFFCWTLSISPAFCVHNCFHLFPYVTFPCCWWQWRFLLVFEFIKKYECRHISTSRRSQKKQYFAFGNAFSLHLKVYCSVDDENAQQIMRIRLYPLASTKRICSGPFKQCLFYTLFEKPAKKLFWKHLHTFTQGIQNYYKGYNILGEGGLASFANFVDADTGSKNQFVFFINITFFSSILQHGISENI